ncbi:MAG TPA: metallopeptidase TldD-related protein [Terriglobales bacterium]|nr:metallopeptidase TldD-related protein [Terriglobales bacterium]
MTGRRFAWLLLLAAVCGLPAAAQSHPDSGAADPVLRAMKVELDRSMEKLRLEHFQAPYYIEYSVVEQDQFTANAAFGAVRNRVRVRARLLRAVVRVGDYKQDSYEGAGQGRMDLMPQDDDLLALRHQLWLATDAAYKQALEALTAKQAKLKQLEVEVPVDDFARAPALTAIRPPARLEVDENRWVGLLESLSSLYREAPEVQSLEATLRFSATNRYLVNSEGTLTRQGTTVYAVDVAGFTQAPDGMRLERMPAFIAPRMEELPLPEELKTSARKVLNDLKVLREAPVVEEEYRGPVLLSSGATAAVFLDLVAPNLLGRKPAPGSPARTTGAYASSFKSRVLPEFLSVVDDPTEMKYGDRSLVGTYSVDDEGVQARSVTAVEKGELASYLMSRQPIRDFPASNGHARANGAAPPSPAISNLFVRSSKTVSREELKKKLIELCSQRSLPYGYSVDNVTGRLQPTLVYRIWVKDGREELVRGAVFGELDTRALRNDILAVGDDYKAHNRIAALPESVIAPSLLFDELQIRRSSASKQKLPVYPPPPEGGN